MSTTTPLTDAINALTTYANETTGASDTDLSSAVATLVAGYGGGGGGGSTLTFTYTPSSTVNSFTVDAGNFSLGNNYIVCCRSDNTTNDSTYETIVKGGVVVLSATYILGTGAAVGRIDTLKAGSGTDYWNTTNTFTLSLSGTTLTVTGYKYFKASATYTFTIYSFDMTWE